jgi:hypothetical protein
MAQEGLALLESYGRTFLESFSTQGSLSIKRGGDEPSDRRVKKKSKSVAGTEFGCSPETGHNGLESETDYASAEDAGSRPSSEEGFTDSNGLEPEGSDEGNNEAESEPSNSNPPHHPTKRRPEIVEFSQPQYSKSEFSSKAYLKSFMAGPPRYQHLVVDFNHHPSPISLRKYPV